MSENQNNIKDKSNSKKYFSLIPNIIREMDLDSFAISAYFILLSYADDNSTCFPSNKTIASKMKCSIHTYLKARNILVSKGLIAVTKRKKEDGSFDSTLIQILDIWEKNIAFFNGGGSASHALGVVHHMHEGSASHALEEEPIKKNHIKNKESKPKKAVASAPLASKEAHATPSINKIPKHITKKNRKNLKEIRDGIWLTGEEKEKLLDKTSKEKLETLLIEMEDYQYANNKFYADHYRALLKWIRNDFTKSTPKKKSVDNFNSGREWKAPAAEVFNV